MTTSGLRPVRDESSAAGSKKYKAACVATSLTGYPAFSSSWYNSGVRMAAPDQATPSKTLAIDPLLVQAFHGAEQPSRQLVPADTLIAAVKRAEERPRRRPFQRVGHHQVSG